MSKVPLYSSTVRQDLPERRVVLALLEARVAHRRVPLCIGYGVWGLGVGVASSGCQVLDVG